jgi:GNAT superfamily N-acetyltransferase
MTKLGREKPVHPEWTLGEKLGRCIDVVRTEGLASLWYKVVGECCYRRLVILEHDLPPEVQNMKLPGHVEMRLLTLDDIDAYLDARPEGIRGDIRGRLQHGQICFTAWQEGSVVGAVWAATGQAYIEYVDCSIALDPDQVYVYNAFTRLSHRGQHIARERALFVAQYLQRAGYRKLLGAVMPENKAALRAPNDVGARHIGWLRRYQFGPWRRFSLKVKPGDRAFRLLQ